jgi:hypothetical protein
VRVQRQLAARRLSAEDLGLLALENAAVAGHTCKVIMVRGSLDLDRLRPRWPPGWTMRSRTG